MPLTTVALPSFHDNSRTSIPTIVADLLTERIAAWRDRLILDSSEEEWVFEQMVALSLRLDDCQARQRALSRYEAVRAATRWDEDRRLETEELAASISKRPEIVARRLRASKAGCDWLLDRWAYLERVLDEAGPWDDRQTALAFDLRGIPKSDRLGEPWDAREGPRALIDRERAELSALKSESLDQLDAIEREAAERGAPIHPSRRRRALHREEADCRRSYDRLRTRLRAVEAPPAESEWTEDAPRHVEEPPRMTDDDWRDYEREILQSWMRGQIEPNTSSKFPESEAASHSPPRPDRSSRTSTSEPDRLAATPRRSDASHPDATLAWDFQPHREPIAFSPGCL
ncbi:MAG: hypothetical protein AB7I30_04360 [Isosphaeraceae bacterium]